MVGAYLSRQGRGSGVFDLTGHEMPVPALHQSSALVEHVGPRVGLCDGIPELMGEGELAGCPIFAVLQRQERKVALNPCRVVSSPAVRNASAMVLWWMIRP